MVKEGKRSKKKAITPQYELQENLKVAEVALILKQKIEARDPSATLIDLEEIFKRGNKIKISSLKK